MSRAFVSISLINALIRYSPLVCLYFGVKVLILDKYNITQMVLLIFRVRKHVHALHFSPTVSCDSTILK